MKGKEKKTTDKERITQMSRSKKKQKANINKNKRILFKKGNEGKRVEMERIKSRII